MIKDDVSNGEKINDEKILVKKLAEKNKRVFFEYLFCKKGRWDIIDKIKR